MGKRNRVVDTSVLRYALEVGEKHKEYYCRCCAWAEDSAKLELCPMCKQNINCYRCRNGLGFCHSCSEFDLPPEVEVVGTNDKFDISFSVQTWVGVCIASHYYLDIKAASPYQRYGNLKIDTDKIRFTTEKSWLIPKYIRRVLKVLVARHKDALRKRKGGKLKVRIECEETRYRLLKAQLSKPLSGD